MLLYCFWNQLIYLIEKIEKILDWIFDLERKMHKLRQISFTTLITPMPWYWKKFINIFNIFLASNSAMQWTNIYLDASKEFWSNHPCKKN